MRAARPIKLRTVPAFDPPPPHWTIQWVKPVCGAIAFLVVCAATGALITLAGILIKF